MRKRLVALPLFVFIALLTTPAWSYQYLPAATAKDYLLEKRPMQLVDIQVEQEFNQHHLPGALATYAYPVKSADDLAKLDAVLPQLQSSAATVVIVCPRGGGGAKRAYDHLQKQGIAAKRLFILEKGQQGWPYPEQLAMK